MVDKYCIQQILGSLMRKPTFLSQVDKYQLTPLDFPSRFEKYIFAAIDGLYRGGAVNTLSVLDVSNFITADTTRKAFFEAEGGSEYLMDCFEYSEPGNFDYYYNKLKKINLLNDLKKNGYDIGEFWCDDPTNPQALDINGKFDALTPRDITESIKRKLLGFEKKYSTTSEVEIQPAAEGMAELVEYLKENVDIGLPIQGDIYCHVISGAQRGALTIRSGSSGLGKTRQAVGDACYLAYPIRYNRLTEKWEETGNSERVLFIVTEQTLPQVKKLILAYLTDIDDSRFKYANWTAQEDKIIHQALEIMQKYEKNMILIKVPNPTIELIKTLVRENVLMYDIGYVFYDYIFIGPALLNEFRGFSLRNDEVLLMFATALKDLAVELNVCMMTSTQVNAQAEDTTKIRNEGSLAGGRATINKADNGAIMSRPSPDELELLDTLVSQYGKPNVVTDIFKVRNGRWTQVRIWSIVDLGRMKREDLFITDEKGNAIEGFEQDFTYRIKNWDSEDTIETERFLNELNGTNQLPRNSRELTADSGVEVTSKLRDIEV